MGAPFLCMGMARAPSMLCNAVCGIYDPTEARGVFDEKAYAASRTVCVKSGSRRPE